MCLGGGCGREVALWGEQRGKKKRFWCFLLMPVVWEDSDMHRQPEEGTRCWRWLQASIQGGAAHREGRGSAWEGNGSRFMFSLSFLTFSLQGCGCQRCRGLRRPREALGEESHRKASKEKMKSFFRRPPFDSPIQSSPLWREQTALAALLHRVPWGWAPSLQVEPARNPGGTGCHSGMDQPATKSLPLSLPCQNVPSGANTYNKDSLPQVAF